MYSGRWCTRFALSMGSTATDLPVQVCAAATEDAASPSIKLDPSAAANANVFMGVVSFTRQTAKQ